MDRNSIIGIVLIALIFVLWGVLSKPSKEEIARQKHMADSIALVQSQQASENAIKADTSKKVDKQITDSVQNKILASQYGSFSSAAKDSQQFFVLENEKIKVTLSNKGGRPYSAQLKEYHRADSSDLILFKGDSTMFGFNIPTNQNRTIFTNDLYFKEVGNLRNVSVQKGQQPGSIALRLNAGPKSYIEYVYSLAPESYMVNLKINMVGMDSIVASNYNNLGIIWKSIIPAQEKGRQNENSYTTIFYKHLDGDVESLNGKIKAGQSVNKDVTTSVKWIAFKQHFFSSVLIADNKFSSASVVSTNQADTSTYLKTFEATLPIDFDHKPLFTSGYKFYFGPNHYNTLKAYKLDLEQLIPLGWSWIRPINKYFIIPIFNWLDNYISNYGIIILIMTFLIKMILFPLTYKSYQSQAKMRVLKPQIDEINAKIPKDKALERQQATMALYKKAGVNPMGGCLPMLLQMPILFSMFYFFPSSIELRQQSFLWATDLSTYDSIFSWTAQIPLISQFYGNHISLFTILMTVSTLLSMKMSNQAQMSDAQLPGMKTMMYIMPVMFMFVLNSFSSGLTYYYFLANMITIGQNEVFKRMIDEKKILAKIHANKAKPVKKSAFQERLEKMAKERGKLPQKRK